MAHSSKRVTCETCGRVYCPECDSVCPVCCIHGECQAKLQQAQEERDEVNETLILIRGRELEAISRWRGEDVQRYLTQPDYGELLDWLNAERDAAIERGAEAWLWADKERLLRQRYQVRTSGAEEAVRMADYRTEAAKTELAEQQALTEEMAEHLHQQLRGYPPVAEVLARWNKLKAPAEAQKEGDGG
jgi:hypothetical protein